MLSKLMFCIWYCKFSLPFYPKLKVRKYLTSKLWCSTLEIAIEFEWEYMRCLYSSFDIC